MSNDPYQNPFMQAQYATMLQNQYMNMATAVAPNHAGSSNPFAPLSSTKRKLAMRAGMVKYLPDTLGWRYWYILPSGLLASPQQKTIWATPELKVPAWDDKEAVRGKAGIHALFAPERWRELVHAEWFADENWVVTGLVERFGHYVLGEDGWRAEWVFIKELSAPSEMIAAGLRKTYPDVAVHLDIEGEDHGYRASQRGRRERDSKLQADTDDGSRRA